MNKKALLFLMLCSLAFNACEEACHIGVGEIKTKELSLGPLNSIDLLFDANVILKQGDEQFVEISAQENIIEYLNKDISEGTWYITPIDGCLDPSEDVTIDISVPALRKITLSNDRDLSLTQPFVGMETFEAQINNSGSLRMAGDSNNAKVTLEGSGDFGSFDFKANNAEIISNGTGDVEITVENSLRVTINGSGNVSIKGDPDRVVPILNGTGRLIKL